MQGALDRWDDDAPLITHKTWFTRLCEYTKKRWVLFRRRIDAKSHNRWQIMRANLEVGKYARIHYLLFFVRPELHQELDRRAQLLRKAEEDAKVRRIRRVAGRRGA